MVGLGLGEGYIGGFALGGYVGGLEPGGLWLGVGGKETRFGFAGLRLGGPAGGLVLGA